MKRSAQVALVVAAATGIGGTSYALMSRDNCVRADGGASLDPSSPACRGGSSGGSGGGHGSRTAFGSYGGSNSASASSATSSSTSTAGSVQRGGFGSFFHSIGAHLGG